MKTTAKLAQLARSGESDNMMAVRAGPSQAAAVPRSLDTMSHFPTRRFSRQKQTTILINLFPRYLTLHPKQLQQG